MDYSKKLRHLFSFLLFTVIPCLFFPFMASSYDAPKTLMFITITSALLGITCYNLHGTMRWFFKIGLVDIFTAWYLLIIVVSSTLIFPVAWGNSKLITQIGLVLFFFILQTEIRKLEQTEYIYFLKLVFYCTLFGLLVVAVYAWLEYFNVIAYIGRGFYKTHVKSTFPNPNHTGGYLATLLPIAVSLYLIERIFLRKIFILFCILVGLGAILMTESRGAVLAVLAGLLVIAIPSLKKLWQKLKGNFKKHFLMVTITAIVVFFSIVLYHINPESSLGRIFIWRVSWGMIKDHPLTGIGFGAYPAKYLNYQSKFFEEKKHLVYQDKADNIKEAHNEFIELLAELGPVGLGLFCFIVITAFCYAYQLIKRKKKISPEMQWIIYGLSGSLTAILINALVDSPLHRLPIQIVFYSCLAILSGAFKDFVIKNEKPTPLWAWTKSVEVRFDSLSQRCSLYILVALSLIGILFSLKTVWNEGVGQIFWQKGNYFVRQELWGRAVHEYQKAIHYIPANGELQFRLGSVYVMQERYQEALVHLQTAKKSFNDKNVYINLAMCYSGLKNYVASENELRKVISMYPNLLVPKLLLGKVLVEQNRYADARTMLEAIITQQPKIVSAETNTAKLIAKQLLASLPD